MTPLLLLLLAAVDGGPAVAAPAAPPVLTAAERSVAVKLRNDARAGTGASELVRSLTDTVGPRLSGSKGYAQAVKWARDLLPTLGLQNVHVEPVKVPHWVRGEETAALVTPVEQRLVVTALGGSVPTPSGGLTAPVLMTSSMDTLTALLQQQPDAARGKIVVFTQKAEKTKSGEGYGRAAGNRTRGPALAGKAGAVAMLVRSVGTSRDRLPHTGTLAYDDKLPKLPAAALSELDVELLTRLMKERGALTLHLQLSCHSEPDADAFNVVGEVVGREHPEEVVLLGAHLDSWDLGTGAIDDAAGVAVVAEAAHRLASLPERPRRTVRVVLYANEENGGKGADAYQTQHKAELAQHVLATEVDEGTDEAYELATAFGPGSEPFTQQLMELLGPVGIKSQHGDGQTGFDVDRLRQQGVPLAHLQQDTSRYFDIHHSADDTFDQIDAQHLDQLVAAVATLAYTAAEAETVPARLPPPPPPAK